MTRFFLRIFVSVWIILAVTAGLTITAARYLPQPEYGNPSQGYEEQMINLISSDLEYEMEINPVKAPQRLIDQHVLDYDQILQIFVIDSNGNDILDRDLPAQVRRVHDRTLRATGSVVRARDPRITIQEKPRSEYLVVGYQGVFPFSRIMRMPRARTLFLLVAFVVSTAISYVLARFIVQPIRHLRIAGHEVAQGNLTVRVGHTVEGRDDDIAMLARDFDVMTERIDDLLKNQQRLMRDVSHELRSPLGRLRAMLSIAEQSGDEKTLSHLGRMEIEVQRLDHLIGEILTFARLEAKSEIDRQSVDIMDLMHEIAADVSLEGSKDEKEVVVSGPESCLMQLDSDLIHSSVENVVRNGLRYTPTNTKVEICVEQTRSEVEISIRDYGAGVAENILPLLFNPFFRADEERGAQSKAGGVGLAIAKRGIELHRGKITAKNCVDDGLKVTIRLPL